MELQKRTCKEAKRIGISGSAMNIVIEVSRFQASKKRINNIQSYQPPGPKVGPLYLLTLVTLRSELTLFATTSLVTSEH